MPARENFRSWAFDVQEKQMIDDLTAERILTLLKLEPHATFLGASTEWPGVEPADVEIGNVEPLAAKYPGTAAHLRAFQQGRGD